MESDKPFVIDEITLICNGCQAERKFKINPHMRSAKELIKWMQTAPTPCPCGAKTCDVKARMAEQH